jgi:hypothetical protein
MIKVCENLGAVNYSTLATYRYLFDRTKPFERHADHREEVSRRSAFCQFDPRIVTFALPFGKRVTLRRRSVEDPVAQLVEHNTFNVGVLGSSPSGITTKTSAKAGVFLPRLAI